MKNNLSKCLLAAVIIVVLMAVPAAAWVGTSSEGIYPEGDLMPGESAGIRHHKLCLGRAVRAAAHLLQNL